jgi:5-methylcytosine-specific restriction endonuclease McrA
MKQPKQQTTREKARPKPVGYHWDQKEPVERQDGKKPCRWCKGPVAKGRKRWCGDECVTEWTRRTQWPVTRDMVFDRAKGICASCGQDCREVDQRRIDADCKSGVITRQQYDRLCRGRVMYRSKHRVPVSHCGWEVDHIRPIFQGGDWFDFGNLQLLCFPCHKAKSEADRKLSQAWKYYA